MVKELIKKYESLYFEQLEKMNNAECDIKEWAESLYIYIKEDLKTHEVVSILLEHEKVMDDDLLTMDIMEIHSNYVQAKKNKEIYNQIIIDLKKVNNTLNDN